MTPGQEEHEGDELPAGATVGSYEIVERIGAGGMGDVYRARHKAIGRAAAVKVLRADRAQDARALDLFLKEATTLGALSHRNLVEVLDFGHLPNGQPFLTMAFVDGKTLHDTIAESLAASGAGLSVALALTVTEQVLNALGEAHKKGIVHRDLKPANIMLLKEHSGETLVKVLDFGLARPVEGAVLPWAGLASTKQSSAAGTPAYVSPEQVRNEDLDGRTDLYSLGCTLYEMLAGQAPFVSESPLALVKMQLDASPPPLAHLVPNLPEEVERLVLWLLQKNRADRPESADVARLEVRRLLTKLSRESTVVRAASSLPSLRKLSRDDVPAAAVDTAPEALAPSPKRWPWVLVAAGVVVVSSAGLALLARPPEVVTSTVALPVPAPVVAVPEPVVAVPEPVVAVPEPVVAVPEPVAPAPQPAAEVPAPGEPSAAFDVDELAPLDVRAPKEVRKVARPVPACTFDDAFKALARRDMQALSAEAARKGLPAAVLRSLDDEFGNAMVGRDCRGALRALDKVRRHASSR